MGTGFNSTGKAKRQKGPDVLTGHCGANRVWERERSISTILRTGGFLCPTHGEILRQKLPSKRQEMRNLHMHQYCECNMFTLLIMETPHWGGIHPGLGTFPTLSYLVFAQRLQSWLYCSHFTGKSVQAKITFTRPEAFSLSHEAIQIEAQACMTLDLGLQPPRSTEIIRQTLRTPDDCLLITRLWLYLDEAPIAKSRAWWDRADWIYPAAPTYRDHHLHPRTNDNHRELPSHRFHSGLLGNLDRIPSWGTRGGVQPEHFSPGRQPRRETLPAGFSSPLLQTQKEWGQCVCWMKKKILLCEMCVRVSQSLEAVAKASPSETLSVCASLWYWRHPEAGAAEWRLPSCQELDPMAFWAQLLRRSGTAPEGNVSSPNCRVHDDGGRMRFKAQRSPFSRALLSPNLLVSSSRSSASL